MNVNPGVQHIQQCTVVSKLKIKTRHFHEVLYNVLGRLITNDLQSNQHRWLLFVWRSWIHDSLLPLEAPTLRWGSHEMTTDTYLRCWYLRRSVLMSISVSSSRPFMSIHSIPSNLLWGLGPPSSGKTNEVSKLSSGSGLSVPSLGGGTAFPREGIFDLRKKLHLLDFFVFDSEVVPGFSSLEELHFVLLRQQMREAAEAIPKMEPTTIPATAPPLNFLSCPSVVPSPSAKDTLTTYSGWAFKGTLSRYAKPPPRNTTVAWLNPRHSNVKTRFATIPPLRFSSRRILIWHGEVHGKMSLSQSRLQCRLRNPVHESPETHYCYQQCSHETPNTFMHRISSKQHSWS